MQLDAKVLDRIRNIKWFENCGANVNIKTNVAISYIDSWRVAQTYYEDSKWDDVTLEARNDLTQILHHKCRNDYLEWNKLVKEAKLFIDVEVVPKIIITQKNNKLNATFNDSVKWDILNAIMESSFKKCNHNQTFFSDLLFVYASGNFPCGWLGNYPSGKLLVY